MLNINSARRVKTVLHHALHRAAPGVDVLQPLLTALVSPSGPRQVQACVLYIEPVTRLVALSLRRHLLAPGSLVDLAPAGGDRIGEVVDGCRVTSMHNMSGALLELPDQTRAFVHVSGLPADQGLLTACTHDPQPLR